MRLSDGNTVSVVQTVLETFKASIKEARGFLSLPVLILFLLIAICLWNPIRNSKITFKHPVFLFAGLYTMYAGCIAPGIYTGFGYHKEWYMNAIYFIFLLFLFGSLLILECSFIRKLEKSAAESDAVHNMKTEAVVILQAFDCFGKRYGIRFLCILICLLVVGMSADVISNIPCVNAVKCLLDGSAKEFHASMKNREAYVLSVENFEDMQLSYYQNAPAIFKHDSLPFNGIYGVIRYYKWYLQMLQK